MTQTNIAIADYGIGNLGSVPRAFRRAGAEVVLTGGRAVLRAADALILPGDGAFGATMDGVTGGGLLPVLRETVEAGKPLLGICIGMQLLFEESEEHGRHRGLGVLPGRGGGFDQGPTPAPQGREPPRGPRPPPPLGGLGGGPLGPFRPPHFSG